jgi:hypothetical protein
MKSDTIIVGAGFAGLLAAIAFPKALVYEQRDKLDLQHKALLRFRDNSVPNLTGIPFKPVTVRKAIWYHGQFREPTIELANRYSQKVTGEVRSRSIWNLNAVERFIAPDDFYEQLLDKVRGRIDTGYGLHDAMRDSPQYPIVSTAPMATNLTACGIGLDVSFNHRPITVHRAQIIGAPCDVYQTVYFPGPRLAYRASITGNTLIVENIRNDERSEAEKRDQMTIILRDVFGIDTTRFDLSAIETVEQSRGKIAPIDEQIRRDAIFAMSHNHNLWSLGRYATWRNILLDDVVDDIERIKLMINSSRYSRLLRTNK